MSLKWLIQKYKNRKLSILENYIENLTNTYSGIDKNFVLSLKSPLDLSEPDYDNLYSHLKAYDALLEKYQLKRIISGKSDFEKALSLMNWLTNSTYYNGQQLAYSDMLPDDSLAILKYSYNKPFRYAINCRYKAIVFTDLLIALGFKAYPVVMYDCDGFGNHLTVHCYLNDMNKWVLFDPSFNTYFTDNNSIPLDVYEIKAAFSKGEEPIICGYNFNGTKECFEIYKYDFIKMNLAGFSTWRDNSENGRKRTMNIYKTRKNFNCSLPLLQGVQGK